MYYFFIVIVLVYIIQDQLTYADVNVQQKGTIKTFEGDSHGVDYTEVQAEAKEEPIKYVDVDIQKGPTQRFGDDIHAVDYGQVAETKQQLTICM